MTWARFQGTIKHGFGDGELAWLKLSDGTHICGKQTFNHFKSNHGRPGTAYFRRFCRVGVKGNASGHPEQRIDGALFNLYRKGITLIYTPWWQPHLSSICSYIFDVLPCRVITHCKQLIVVVIDGVCGGYGRFKNKVE
jgi:hypothetical protein